MKLNDISQALLAEAGMTDHTNWKHEMDRIAAHWKEQGGKKMSEDELADAIGNDLEQLDYSPDEIEEMLPAIVTMVKHG